MWMDCFAITQSARFLKNTEKMTRITFEKILIENDILWNDLVEIEVFNPNYVKTFFGKYPKTIKFFGALGYHYGDNDVKLFVEDDDKPFETKIIYFNFEQILNIKKWRI